MQTALYRVILKDAWNAVRRHKQLWVWGLFAALLGNAGEYQVVLTTLDRVSLGQPVPVLTSTFGGAFPTIGSGMLFSLASTLSGDLFTTLLVVVAGLLLLACTFLFIWLTMVAVVSLIQSGLALSRGDEVPSLSASVTSARHLFGPVLVLYVMGRIVTTMFVMLVVLFGLLALADVYVGLPLFVVAALVVLPAVFLISFVIRYALMFLVQKPMSILEAIQRAVRLVQANWLVTLELALVLFVINTLIGMTIALAIYGLVLPMFQGAFVLWAIGAASQAMTMTIVAIVLFTIAVFGLGAFLGSFQWTAWTLLFRRLQERRSSLSKIIRVTSRFLPNRPVKLFGA